MLRVAAAALVVAQLGGCLFGCEMSQRELAPPDGSYRVVTVVSRAESEPRRIGLAYVRPEFFGGVAVKPLVGRFFVPHDFKLHPATDVVGVLEYRYWVEHLGSQPEHIGRKMQIDNIWPTIVGVAPKDFVFPHGSRVAVPELR